MSEVERHLPAERKGRGHMIVQEHHDGDQHVARAVLADPAAGPKSKDQARNGVDHAKEQVQELRAREQLIVWAETGLKGAKGAAIIPREGLGHF